jgi:hypothetical protein
MRVINAGASSRVISTRADRAGATQICAEFHTCDIRHVLESDITRMLENAGYSAMCTF